MGGCYHTETLTETCWVGSLADTVVTDYQPNEFPKPTPPPPTTTGKRRNSQ